MISFTRLKGGDWGGGLDDSGTNAFSWGGFVEEGVHSPFVCPKAVGEGPGGPIILGEKRRNH